jgi:hypothetical protein
LGYGRFQVEEKATRDRQFGAEAAAALERYRIAFGFAYKADESDCKTAKTAETAEKSAIAEIAAKYAADFKLIFEDVKNGTAPETAGQQIAGLGQLVRDFGTDVKDAKKDAKAKLEILAAAENADKSAGEETE